MAQTTKPTPPALWGIPTILAKGFEQITRHWWLILLPILLDLFLWLGPRLTVTQLMMESLALLPQQGALGVYREQMLELATRVNLWTALSFPVGGMPALMTGMTPEKTPIPTLTVELPTLGLWFLAFAAINLLGFLLATLNLNLLAQAIDPIPFMSRLVRSTWQLLGLVVMFGIFLFTLTLLLTPIAILTAALGLGIMPAFLLGSLITVWVVIYLMFTPHYILLQKQNLFEAMRRSVFFVRQQLVPVLWLSMILLSAGTLLKNLWRLADNGSWLTVISIFGHSFINTALLLATFIFFQHYHPETNTTPATPNN